jgi:hypothetical protein
VGDWADAGIESLRQTVAGILSYLAFGDAEVSERSMRTAVIARIASAAPIVAALCVLTQCHSVPVIHAQQCRRVVLRGHVEDGKSWNRPIGQGWVFRVIPINPLEKRYSGWDLVMDRARPAGFPDALLLATPPYESINQREIGTTFGLRAQDAIGWNPRSFRFLTGAADLRKAQKLYFEARNEDKPVGKNAQAKAGEKPAADPDAATRDLMEIVKHSAAGQFRILNAELTPGTANALPYAENWALQQRNTPHTIKMTDSPSPAGKLYSLQFEVTLWLPSGWKTPKGFQSQPSPCQ